MTDTFIRKRITELRLKKGVSEYKMSIDLGHSKGYIQSISSGRALPSLWEFIYICDYLEVTPKDFFDCDTNDPALINKLHKLSYGLSDADLMLLINLAERLSSTKQ